MDFLHSCIDIYKENKQGSYASSTIPKLLIDFTIIVISDVGNDTENFLTYNSRARTTHTHSQRSNILFKLLI